MSMTISFISQEITSSYGTLTINTNGSWSYVTLESVYDTIVALPEDSYLIDSFNVHASNGEIKRIHIKITGINDASIISSTEPRHLIEDTVTEVTGKLTVTDVDTNQSSFRANTIKGFYGTLSLLANGSWTYTLIPENTQALAENQYVKDDIILYSLDGTPFTLSFNILGLDDTPTISGDSYLTLVEDKNVVNGYLSASGKLTIDDPEPDQALFIPSSTYNTINSSSFSITEDGTWNFKVLNNSTFVQNIKENETRTITYSVKTRGGDQHTLFFAIKGTYDYINGDFSGAVIEDDADILTTSGQLDAPFEIVPATKTGFYKSQLYIDSSGHWTYTADNSHPAIQELSASSFITESFDIYFNGSPDVTTITITIYGTNDKPSLLFSISSFVIYTNQDVSPDGFLFLSDQVIIRDRDLNQAFFVPATVSSSLGTLTISSDGKWIYSCKNDHPEISKLTYQNYLYDNFDLIAVDGSSFPLSIKIIGSDIKGATNLELKARFIGEATTLRLSGNLTYRNPPSTIPDTGTDSIGLSNYKTKLLPIVSQSYSTFNSVLQLNWTMATQSTYSNTDIVQSRTFHDLKINRNFRVSLKRGRALGSIMDSSPPYHFIITREFSDHIYSGYDLYSADLDADKFNFFSGWTHSELNFSVQHVYSCEKISTEKFIPDLSAFSALLNNINSLGLLDPSNAPDYETFAKSVSTTNSLTIKSFLSSVDGGVFPKSPYYIIDLKEHIAFKYDAPSSVQAYWLRELPAEGATPVKLFPTPIPKNDITVIISRYIILYISNYSLSLKPKIFDSHPSDSSRLNYILFTNFRNSLRNSNPLSLDPIIPPLELSDFLELPYIISAPACPAAIFEFYGKFLYVSQVDNQDIFNHEPIFYPSPFSSSPSNPLPPNIDVSFDFSPPSTTGDVLRTF